MRVLFLTNIPSPYRVGFFEELGKLCFLTVLYEKGEAADRNQAWLDTRKKEYYTENYLKSVYQNDDNAFCPEVKKYLDQKMFDVIVVGVYSTPTGMYAIHYLKRKHIPFWISCDGGLIKKDHFWKYKIKSYFLSGAAGYLSSGDQTDRYLCHYGAKQEKIYHYPFSSIYRKDLLACQPDSGEKKKLRDELGISGERVILSVGQFIYRKGYDLLLKAAADLPDQVSIYLIGDIPGEEYLRLIEQYQLTNIYFIPFQPFEKLQEYYRAADLFVLPTREDIWGLVINEALANALPVITTDQCVAGLELIENGKNGEIIPAGRVDELSAAIKRELSLPQEERTCQQKNCLEKIREYTIENMAKHYCEAFND